MATFHLWKDSAGEYYWILKSDENHETVARSSESYRTTAGAKHSIEWVRANAAKAGLSDHT